MEKETEKLVNKLSEIRKGKLVIFNNVSNSYYE